MESTNHLTELRELRGISRPGLADRLGVSENTVRRWEREGELVPVKHLVPLAEILGVTTDELLGREQEPAPAAA